MVGGRSGQVRNVPTDFTKAFRTQIERYLVGIGDAEVGQVGPISCISAETSRCIEIPQKCARKSKIESCEKWSGEGRNTSATSLRTSYEAFGPISGDIWSASAMPKSAKFKQSAAFWLKSRDASKLTKNGPKNPKMKDIKNGRGKVRRSPQSLDGLLTKPPERFRVIYDRHQ